MPVRCFLSYAHENGGFVASVAQRLGRARVLFDRQSFRLGEDFRDAIRRCLSGSDLVALFASAESLESTWVQFEMHEAEARRLQGGVKRLLVLTIDRTDTLDLLPPWLKTGLVVHAPRPAQAERAIAEHMNLLETGARLETLYFGRESDQTVIADKVATPIGQPEPHVLIVHGLPGVGRRTFLAKAMSQNLSLNYGPEYTLTEADALDSIHLKLVQDAIELRDQDELRQRTAAFAAVDVREKSRTLAELLRTLADGRYGPVIIDNGSLLDEYGLFRPGAVSLLEAITATPDLHVGFVMSRAPQALPPLPLVVHRVREIGQQAVEKLLTQAFRMKGISATTSQIAALAPYCAGYPPAAQMVVHRVERDGIDATLAEKHLLEDITDRLFTPVISRLGLSDTHWAILKYLAQFESLPLDVIARAIGLEREKVAAGLRELIALNLAQATPVGMTYAISAPVRRAVSQRAGDLSPREFAIVASAIRETVWKLGTDAIVPVAFVDAFLTAVAKADPLPPPTLDFGAYELPSTLLRVAREAYDARNSERALEYIDRVLALDPGRELALELAVKANARLERWDAAESRLQQIEKKRLRSRHYLRGFLEWKRGDLQRAVDAFRSAIAAGERHRSVYRDLAFCLFRLRRPLEARSVLEQMTAQQANNQFVLDLQAQISIYLHDYSAAQKAVDELREQGFEADYFHRQAHLWLQEGRIDEALEMSQRAVAAAPHRHETKAVRIDILIAARQYDAARSELASLPLRNQGDRDVQCGLQAKLALEERGDWQVAADWWQRIVRKDTTVHRGIRARILETALQSRAGLAEQAEFRAELDDLRRRDEAEDVFESFLSTGG